MSDWRLIEGIAVERACLKSIDIALMRYAGGFFTRDLPRTAAGREQGRRDFAEVRRLCASHCWLVDRIGGGWWR